MRIAIVGGGVVGVTSAWYLACKGHQVTVFERQSDVALETSYANGGQISVSHAEPWANPHTPRQVLRWLGREDAPLLYRLRLDPALWRWTLAFMRECLPARTRDNIRRIVDLAAYSRDELSRLRGALQDQGGLDYDAGLQGILHIYTDAAEFARAGAAAAVLREFGCDRSTLSVDEAVRIEPALAPVRAQLVGADHTARDESGDARRFTAALAAHCRRLGVQFRFGSTITAFNSEGGRIRSLTDLQGRSEDADAFVLAAGSYSPLLARSLGLRLPVYPAKGYSATVELAAGSPAPVISITDDARKIVFSRLGNRLRIAGTAEFAGYDHRLNAVRCQALIAGAHALFPELRTEGEPAFWCGLRPATPSGVPLLGASPIPNLWLNTGHGTLGWTMACGSAAALADLIDGRVPQVALRPPASG